MTMIHLPQWSVGQNLTIITPDQPLYNRGEELVWQITSLKVSSFSWDDPASASTSSKALANTWTMQDFDQAHPVNPDLAGVFMQIRTLHFGEHITRVDVVLDRYIWKEPIKGLVRSKRVCKMFIEGPLVPLPQRMEHLHCLGWKQGWFLSDVIMIKVKDQSEWF